MMRRSTVLVVAGIVLGCGLIGAGVVDRTKQIDRINSSNCRQYNTLYNIIANAPPINRPLYRRIGLSEVVIDEIEAVSEANRDRTLRELGTRPPDCKKGVVR